MWKRDDGDDEMMRGRGRGHGDDDEVGQREGGTETAYEVMRGRERGKEARIG